MRESVQRRFFARRSARIAAAVLGLLYAAAVFAPVLANDRPYMIEAIDYGAYRQAREGLLPPVQFLATGLALEEATDEQLAAERTAVHWRTATMRRFVWHPMHAAERWDLDDLQRLEEHVDLAVRERSTAAAEEALAIARVLQTELWAARSAIPGGVSLVPARSYPLGASLTGLDVGAMLLALAAVLAIVLRLARRRVALLFGLAILGGVVFQLAGDGPERVGSWKQAIASGDVEVTRVVFPPLAMGYDESRLSESFRPPTWAASSELTTDGHYVRGARSPSARAVGEPVPSADPVEVRSGEPGLNHPLRHPLGTDALGRDLLVRLLWGGRISLAVGFVSALILVVLGVLIGSAAGYLGGRTDTLLSRLIEIVQCFPAFFLIVTAVALVPERTLHPLFTVVIVIGLVSWTGIARLVRAEFLRARELDYVAAARALGLGAPRIVFGHVLPNVLGPVLVAGAFAVASGILIESGVSFLGFGVRQPVPSWGALLGETRTLQHWWVQLFPGTLILLAVLSTHLLGEALRDALDPRVAGGADG
jgi:peptide/nickel transport system permease protein